MFNMSHVITLQRAYTGDIIHISYNSETLIFLKQIEHNTSLLLLIYTPGAKAPHYCTISSHSGQVVTSTSVRLTTGDGMTS